MEDEDLARKLAFVRPERRLLVEKRIGVLERYLARDKGDAFDSDRAAADLGMSRPGFFRLLRAWRQTRDPVKAGVTRPHGPRGRNHHGGDGFVETVLHELPAGRPLQRDVKAIEAAAREAGVEIRSTSALTAMVRDLRAVAPFRGPLIDHVALNIPCASPDGPVMPVATILADGCTRTVHAVTLRLEPADAVAAATVLRHACRTGAVGDQDEQGRRTIAIDAPPDPKWFDLFDTLRQAGLERTGAERRVPQAGRLARSLVFPTLLGLATHPKLVHQHADARRIRSMAERDELLSLDRAQALMDDMVRAARGNAALPLVPDVDSLIRRLDKFLEV